MVKPGMSSPPTPSHRKVFVAKIFDILYDIAGLVKMQFFRKDNQKLMNILKWTGISAVTFGFITTLFVSPPNVEITRQYFEFGLDRIILLLFLFTALFNLKGHWGKGLSFLFIFLLFYTPLIYKWQTVDNYSTLGGILPLRDANTYYQGAQNIFHGYPLMGTAAYRPMFTSFLAVIMILVNHNLQSSLILIVALNALVMFLTAREIQEIFKNNFAVALYVVLSYMFYRRFGGTLLTENLGFCLGNLALLFLIHGSVQQKLTTILYGLFLLTTGLNARAGAFLILPVLAVWLGISFRSLHGFWRPFFLGCVAILLGMASNWVLVKSINSSSSSAFSNYSYTLYGIAVGNKGWEQAGTDYPDASTGEIYNLAFQKIKNEPGLFLKGVAGAYSDYFVTSRGAFSFLLLKHDRNDVANLILWGLSFAGLGVAILMRREKYHSIALAFFIGVLLSVGLVPPSDSSMMRAYATTIPMSCYIVVMGVTLPGHWLQKTETSPEFGKAKLATPFVISLFLLSASLLLPIPIRFAGNPLKVDPAVPCDPRKNRVAFTIADGSSITLESKKGYTFVPALEFFRFAGKMINPDQQLTQEEISLILDIGPGTTITIIRMLAEDSNNPIPVSAGFLITKGVPQVGVHTLCIDKPQFQTFYFAPADMPQARTFSSSSAPMIQTILEWVRRAMLWAVFILLLTGFTRTFDFPLNKIPLVALNTAVIGCGILLFLHVSGLVPLAWERNVLDSREFRNRGDFMYAYHTGDENISDTNFRDYPSYLYEDGVLLFQPHESQSLIAEIGRGSYIFKEKFLFFSSSDNTSPETNGRAYMIETPMRVRTRYQIIGFGLALVGLFAHLFYFKPQLPKTAGESSGKISPL